MAVSATHTQEENIEAIKSENEEKVLNKEPRYLSIDVFRGLAIISMIFVNVIAPFNTVPAWSKHALDYGLTYVDLVTPFFLFAIGLTYTMSFNQTYEKKGWYQAFLRFLRRYAALYGMGALGATYFFTENGILFSWGVLQAIGLAGIFTMFFIKFHRAIRFVIGLVCLAVYQYILTIPVKVGTEMILLGDLNLMDQHGGIIGGIGFCILLLLCTAIVDDFRKTNKWFILGCGGAFTASGIIWHVIWRYTGWPQFGGISKERVTASYILLTVGLGAILFWLLWFIYDKKQLTKNRSILQPMGRNPLLLYILHPILIALTFLILDINTHVALVMFLGIVSVVILWTLAFFLNRKKFYVVI
ncbi:MAG: DUF1624 domain-containing protein [Candidatus Heimdallarchaeota archaeon]|nr:DUF1624 domain-containing protein [Candidatus Heimdallarchaeota archaeon]